MYIYIIYIYKHIYNLDVANAMMQALSNQM